MCCLTWPHETWLCRNIYVMSAKADQSGNTQLNISCWGNTTEHWKDFSLATFYIWNNLILLPADTNNLKSHSILNNFNFNKYRQTCWPIIVHILKDCPPFGGFQSVWQIFKYWNVFVVRILVGICDWWWQHWWRSGLWRRDVSVASKIRGQDIW